jgi:UV DNA damage endonuclease
MHPDQFTLINSTDREVFRRSAAELLYHAEVLDLLGTDLSAKIQIHVGGAYGNKEASLNRFIRRYNCLPEKVRKRLVIENDERIYSVKDCVSAHKKTGIPVVFDTLHHRCNSGGESMINAFSRAHSTWSQEDGIPIVDYSSQDNIKKKGSHAGSIQMRDFRNFFSETRGFDFDIMCEIKDKERSALRVLRMIHKSQEGGVRPTTRCGG